MGNSESATPAVNMNSKEALFINDAIKSNQVVIFSKSYCPYCKTAKQIFSELNVSPNIVELDVVDNGQTMQDILNQMTGARTVPRIFINGKCIGGARETKSLHNSGKLTDLLNPS